jgi:hypothetical protein
LFGTNIKTVLQVSNIHDNEKIKIKRRCDDVNAVVKDKQRERKKEWKKERRKGTYHAFLRGLISRADNTGKRKGKKTERVSQKVASPKMATTKRKGGASGSERTNPRVWLYSILLTLQYGAQPLISKRFTGYFPFSSPLRFYAFPIYYFSM